MLQLQQSKSSFHTCLLTCGQENPIKGGTVRNPPSITLLPCYLLISHGLSRWIFKIFCAGEGSAARWCPGCPGPEEALPLPFLLPHVLSPMSRLRRLQGVPRSDAVHCSLGCWPRSAKHGVLAQQVFLWPRTSLLSVGSAEGSRCLGRPAAGAVLGGNGAGSLGGAWTARVPILADCSSQLVWRSCSLLLCVTSVLGSQPTLGAFTLQWLVLSAGEDSGSSASWSTPAGVEQNQMGRRKAKSLRKTTGDLWQLGRSWKSPGMDKVPLKVLTKVLLASSCSWRV